MLDKDWPGIVVGYDYGAEVTKPLTLPDVWDTIEPSIQSTQGVGGMAVNLKINEKDFLTNVFGGAVAKSLIEAYKFKFYLYGLDIINLPAKVYVNTGVSTLALATGQCTAENVSLVKSKIEEGLKKIVGLDISVAVAQKEILHEAIKAMPDDTPDLEVPPASVSLSAMTANGEHMAVESYGGIGFLPDTVDKIKSFIAIGDKIAAIKTVREATGLPLKEAKDFVEKHFTATKKYVEFTTHTGQTYGLTGAQYHKIIGLLGDNKLVDAIKECRIATGCGLKEAKDYCDSLNGVTPAQAVEKVLGLETTSQKVIKLRNATQVGQAVHGTSAGSVYYVVAISPNVKVAARLKNGQLSVRAEGDPSPAQVALIENQLGLSEGGGSGQYWSCHFALEGVPVERVIGALLTGCGIEWLAVTSNAALVKKALKC